MQPLHDTTVRPGADARPGFRPLRPLGPLAAAAIVVLTLVIMTPQIVATWGDHARVQDLVAGLMTFEEMRNAELESLTGSTTLLLFGFLGYLAAGVTFLVWVHRARRNADRFSPVRHRLSAGWAVGGWFVPVANWVLPAIVMNDLARASGPRDAERRVDPVVAAWWTAMTLSSVLIMIGQFTIPRPVVTYAAEDPTQIIEGAEEALSSYLSVALVNTASGALLLVAAALVAALVVRISTQQTELFGQGGDAPDTPVPAEAAASIATPVWPEQAPERRSMVLGRITAAAVWPTALAGPLTMTGAAAGHASGGNVSDAALIMIFGVVVLLIGVAVSGILVIVWLWRARRTAEALSPAAHRLSGGWAVAGWLVPVANLMVPAVVVRDVVRAGEFRAPVALWWAGWVGGWAALWLAFAVSADGSREAMGGFSVFAGIATALFVLAAAALTVLVTRVDRWQADRIAARTTPTT